MAMKLDSEAMRTAFPALTVGDLMQTRVHTASPDDTLAHVHRQMRMSGFRHLPVVDGDRLVGVISDRIILLAWARGAETPVRDFMTRYTEWVHPEMLAKEAAARMIHDKIGSLVVVDRAQRVVGIITETDFLRLAHRALIIQEAASQEEG